MKNKQINKVLLMFFLSFTLFFSVSDAAGFEANTDVAVTTVSFQLNYSRNITYGDYTSNQIRNIVTNYYNDKSNETYLFDYNNMISYLSADYDVTIMVSWYDLKPYRVLVVPKNTLDYGASSVQTSYEDVTGVYNNLFLISLSESYTLDVIRVNEANNGCYYGTINTDKAYFSSYLDRSYFIDFSTVDYKFFNYTSNKPISWDGVSYVYEAETEPDAPSANYDLANIVSSIILSSEVQNNTDGTSREFFIVPDGTVGDEEVYELYFYNSRVTLSQFEYVYNDTLYYDLDKTSVKGVLAKLVDFVGGYKSFDGKVNPLAEIKHFTMYYDPVNKISDIYLTSTRSVDTLKSFLSETQPIIYTTKTIPYYSATWGETDTEWTATADSTKDILNEEIKDADGNVISPVVPGSEAILGDTPFETFANFLRALFNSLLNGLGRLLTSIFSLGLDFANGLLNIFGENVVTFVLLIAVKAITVLISSVALIFRFISFIMTLVAIPASSALLAVDVAANTSGLVFTGLNWGTRFIEGLNLLKSFQWNGLGLWTLFEVFVASLEVVFFVKIVRKHYRNL